MVGRVVGQVVWQYEMWAVETASDCRADHTIHGTVIVLAGRGTNPEQQQQPGPAGYRSIATIVTFDTRYFVINSLAQLFVTK